MSFKPLADDRNAIENIEASEYLPIYYALQLYKKFPITEVDDPDEEYFNPIDNARNKVENLKNNGCYEELLGEEERYSRITGKQERNVTGEISVFYFLLKEYGISGNYDIVMQIMDLEENHTLKKAINFLCDYRAFRESEEQAFFEFRYMKEMPKYYICFNPFFLESTIYTEKIPNYNSFCHNLTGDIFNQMVSYLEFYFLEAQKDEAMKSREVWYGDGETDILKKIPPNERWLSIELSLIDENNFYVKFQCKYNEIYDWKDGKYTVVSYDIQEAKMTEKSKYDVKNFLKKIGCPFNKNYRDYIIFLYNTSMIKKLYYKEIFGLHFNAKNPRSRDRHDALAFLYNIFQIFVPSPVKPRQFLNHTHIVGRSGSGKSELLKTIIKQVGESCILLDPHGDIADSLDKKQNFFKIAPTESRFVINPFDIEDKSINNRELVAEEIIQLLQEIIQDSNVSVLMKTISFPIISTLLKLPYADFRMFADCINPISGLAFLERLSPLVDDHHKRLWEDLKTDAYDSTKRSIFNRLQSFLNKHKIISTVCGYDDFSETIKRVEQGENLVISLPIPQLGEDVSEVLGRFFMCRMQIWAKRRQILAEKDRKPVLLIVDECQNYLSEETARTLDQFGRKFGLYMVLAHQHIAQIDGKGLKGSMLANCKNKIVGYCDESTAKPMGNAMGVDYGEFMELKKGHFWGLFEDQKPLKFYARLAKFKTVGEAVNYAQSQNTDFLDGWEIVQDSVQNAVQNTPKTPKFTAKFDL